MTKIRTAIAALALATAAVGGLGFAHAPAHHSAPVKSAHDVLCC